MEENAILEGCQHSKLSFEYANSKVGDADATGIFTVQAMIFL